MFFRFLLQDADTGAPLGTDNVRLSLALVRNTGKLDGTFESRIKDNAGDVLVDRDGHLLGDADRRVGRVIP